MTIINQFLFSCLFFGCYFVPGWFVLKALNLRRHRFLLSFSLSYAFLVITLTVLRFAKLSVFYFAPFILGGSIVLGALWLVRFVWIRYFHNEQNRALRSHSFRFRPGILVPFIALLGLIWLYLWWVGPYLEIPSDVWNHVWRFQNIQVQINAGRFDEANTSFSGMFLRQGNAWYLIIIYLMRWSGISISNVLAPLTVITVSSFCTGIFSCALAVFRSFRISIRQKGWLAAGAALFCVVTMGTSVFTYIRYYALAPTILNYLLFLSAVLVAMDWLENRKWWTNAVWLVPVLMLTMNVVHSQELLFTGFMIMGLALVNIVRGLIGSRRAKPDLGVPLKDHKRALEPVLLAKSLIVAGFAIIIWLGLFVWLRHKNPIMWPDTNTIIPNMPIPAVSVPLVFKAFTISPPSHPVLRLFVYQFYMFYQTIGCWGFFVYIIFLLNFRQMAKSNYLLAGMAMPLLTVFNPITIDLLVRLITLQSPGLPPVAIYRLSYMLPLPFVAVLAFGKAVKSLLWRKGEDGQVTEPVTRRSLAVLIKAPVIIIGLIGLIFPIQNRWVDAPFSRLYTLTDHFGNDVRRWKDLIDLIAGFQPSLLVTDPNTSLIFARLYPEYPSSLCGLQWLASEEPEAQFREALKQRPDLRTKGIVIINRRDGIPSLTGRISRHWPEDAFLTSHFYSSKAIAFVESHTNQFKLLWSRNQVEVFQIIP